MENNYPIKYAVLIVKKKGGYYNYYQDVTLGCIVSKCYVIESSIKYYKDGSNEIENKVFFPYNDISSFETCGLNVEPNRFRLDCNSYPFDYEIVDSLFNTYEEAKEYCEEKNEEMKNHLFTRLNYSSKNKNFIKEYNALLEEYEKDIELCRRYEEFISSKTLDLEITEDYNLQCLNKVKKKQK